MGSGSRTACGSGRAHVSRPPAASAAAHVADRTIRRRSVAYAVCFYVLSKVLLLSPQSSKT